MDTEVLKLVISAVSDIGELGVWGLVAYLVTTILLALIKFGTISLFLYWAIRGAANTITWCSTGLSDAFIKKVRDHYRVGTRGVLTTEEREQVVAKIQEIVRKDMSKDD